jgi:1-aminocyclopropane-1-carboxylate deaminase/D-cysteine desulfhydrase-like pyridoxal-dependent ACC family enzyme
VPGLLLGGKVTTAARRSLASFPRVRLVLGPTPLHPAPRLSAELGVPVLLKRDDLAGVGLGGNKLTEGVFLDPVFGAKAMAALIAECRAGRARGTQVFLVSGGAPTLFAGPRP